MARENNKKETGAKLAGAQAAKDSEKSMAKPSKFADLGQGMVLQGVVKDIKLYGAFIDVGIGRDGLVHISDISDKRVNSVADVLSVGQRIEVWVKDLDPERQRISLSMKPRGQNRIRLRDLKEGTLVDGKVTKIANFGAFVDIGAEADGLIHISELGSGYVRRVSDVLSVDEDVQVQILEVDRRRRRVRLSMKTQREEEVAPAPMEDVRVPTLMEIAFEEARREKARKQRKKTRPSQRDVQRERDAIISRTLEHLVTAE